jgi:hypothetical protein
LIWELPPNFNGDLLNASMDQYFCPKCFFWVETKKQKSANLFATELKSHLPIELEK